MEFVNEFWPWARLRCSDEIIQRTHVNQNTNKKRQKFWFSLGIWIFSETFVETTWKIVGYLSNFLNLFLDIGRRWVVIALQWHHNERNGVSNHRRLDGMLNRLSGADQRKYQSSASLAFVRGIHWWPENDSIWWCHHGKNSRIQGVENVLTSAYKLK